MATPAIHQEVECYVDAVAATLVHGFIGVAELLIIESREREMKRLADQRARAVQLVTDAIFEGRRVAREEVDRYAYSAYLTLPQLADKLDVPLPFLKAGVKRWYHF